MGLLGKPDSLTSNFLVILIWQQARSSDFDVDLVIEGIAAVSNYITKVIGSLEELLA